MKKIIGYLILVVLALSPIILIAIFDSLITALIWLGVGILTTLVIIFAICLIES